MVIVQRFFCQERRQDLRFKVILKQFEEFKLSLLVYKYLIMNVLQ